MGKNISENQIRPKICSSKSYFRKVFFECRFTINYINSIYICRNIFKSVFYFFAFCIIAHDRLQMPKINRTMTRPVPSSSLPAPSTAATATGSRAMTAGGAARAGVGGPAGGFSDFRQAPAPVRTSSIPSMIGTRFIPLSNRLRSLL